MSSRKLPYPVFDADNHFYETQDALTKFLPDNRKNVIDYVQVRGVPRCRCAVTSATTSPTRPSRWWHGRELKRTTTGTAAAARVSRGDGRADEVDPAFREPGPRLEVMDEMGVDYALMFPTLASLVEERMKDDPVLVHDVIHALNRWMYETWSFDYEGRIFQHR